ncbi:enoyl-CoA hydratase-related protein [Microbacterium sp. cf332]|uniref:enoyl-CoA hydratase-related protein n=1 Tax=Microbacterium sp. cf332 TaxID=1761804 RepID=UPI0008856CD6|nr:enoyl-CoA hydratase-related protein [Microbacterium sp. cf332]SDQ94719.1 1,4-Dihydroxy-2-naphthoyl-CoA synthase [Microbacterium sp. cf332]
MTIDDTATTTTTWTASGTYSDITYETSPDGIALITIDRPHKRNAFRPLTSAELVHAVARARHDSSVRVVLLRGAGDQAFCSGADLSERTGDAADSSHRDIAPANVLDVQVAIRRIEKPVIALVAGYAVGGGQVLQQVCDLSIAAENAVFGQVGPRVGSFDGGYGINLLAKQVGHKRAKEIWFLCRRYDAQQALAWGLVNTVVPLDRLLDEGVAWALELCAMSPAALRMLKNAVSAEEDGLHGVAQLANDSCLLYYGTDEAAEGAEAFMQKRQPEFSDKLAF